MSLTDAQRAFLVIAAKSPGNGLDGAIAKGSCRRLMAQCLARLGLVRLVGMGVEEDGPTDNEFPIYAITDDGRAALERARGAV